MRDIESCSEDSVGKGRLWPYMTIGTQLISAASLFKERAVSVVLSQC